MEVECRLRAGLTVTQTGKLFGIAKQTFDLEARLVIAVERENVQGDISAKEYGTTLSLGIDHEDDAQVASELHMIDHLVIEHPMIVLHVEPLKPSQVGPPHLAVVDFGTSRARTLWAIVEIPQIGVCAHSPHFIDIMSMDGLVLVRKDSAGTYAVQLSAQDLAENCVKHGVPAGRVSLASIRAFYRSSVTPEILEGFFARVVVLVEGPTEKLAVPVYLEKSGLNHTREGIAVILVHGKGSLAKWRRLFTAYGIPVYLIFDNDANDDSSGNKRRDALRSVGVADDAAEGYIKATDFVVSDLFCIFGDDFEKGMRRLFPGYEILESEAIQNGGDGKPFIARYAAEQLPFVESAPGWARWKELAEKIRALLPGDSPAAG